MGDDMTFGILPKRPVPVSSTMTLEGGSSPSGLPGGYGGKERTMQDTTGQTTRRAARGAIVAALAGLVLSVAAVSPASGTGESVDREIEGIGHGVVVTTYGEPTTFVGDERAELSHLGDSTIHVQGISTSTETGVELAGTAVIVAANGDELRSTFRGPGTMTPSGLEATVVGAVTGGTGRFEHASGTITDHVVLTVTDVSPPTVTANATSTLSGTVDY